MAGLPWLRFYADSVDNEKLRLLAFEDRWHYVAILCCKQQGIVEQDNKLMVRQLAVKLGVQTRELEEIKRRLMEVELIDDNFEPIGWEKHQYSSDSSKDRVRKYRESKKKPACNSAEPLQNETCNGDVTLQGRYCNAVDTDTDTDTDTDKKQRALPPGLNVSAWSEYIKHRRSSKIKKLTPAGEDKQIRWLVDQGPPDVQQAIIDQTVKNGWQGLFELKMGSVNEANKQNHKPSLAERASIARKQYEQAERQADGESMGADDASIRPPLDGDLWRAGSG